MTTAPDPFAAAREFLHEWMAETDEEAARFILAAGLLPYAAFARAFQRLPPDEQAELIELGQEGLRPAAGAELKLVALARLRRAE